MFLTPLWDAENTSAVWQVYAISEDGITSQVEHSLEQWMGDPSTLAYANGMIAIINHLTSDEIARRLQKSFCLQ